MLYKYNDQYVSAEEMNEIEEMEAAWTADLKKKSEIIINSLTDKFAFAFGPLFLLAEIGEVASKRSEIISKIKDLMEQSCSINTYSNKIVELEAKNSLPVDYTKFPELEYDTVSYVMSEDIDESVVLVYNLGMTI